MYADPVKDPAEVRDLVVLCKGPDKGMFYFFGRERGSKHKIPFILTYILNNLTIAFQLYSDCCSGKTGIVIGIYPGNANDNTVVKLDRVRGMREIRVVPRAWAAKRLGEQDPDDVFLIPRKRESGYGVAGGPI